MTRIEQRFADLKAKGRKGFIAYITAGDPNLAATEDAVLRLEDAGVDIVELGIPFSDPLADGTVNQLSAARALEAGTTPRGVLDCIASIRKRSQLPIMCYTYINPIQARGSARFFKDAKAAGVDGLLILDLPVEEGADTHAQMLKAGLNNIALVTPTSPDERIARIVKSATGFVYCVSRTGVTGMQTKLSDEASAVVKRTKKHTKLPVALGFGISTPDHARAAAKDADAIVVGSAIVNRFHEESHDAEGRRRAAAWVKTLVDAAKGV